MVLGLLGVLGQRARQIAFRFLKQTFAQFLIQTHNLGLCQHGFTFMENALIYISGATQALL